MHVNNHKWLADVRNSHPQHFDGARVLEIGSKNWNGTAREHFANCRYVGIDREPGAGVDIVVDGDDVPAQLQRDFDTLVMLSVFEHDPHWRHTLAKYLPHLRPGALVVTCFGAEGNLPHPPMPWAQVPHREFLDYAVTLPLEVLDSFFENDRYGNECAGCFNVLMRKLGAVE